VQVQAKTFAHLWPAAVPAELMLLLLLV